MKRLESDFYSRGVLIVAPEIIGKSLNILQNGIVEKYLITEVEAYRGEEDAACHANKGRTNRTEIMYHQGGYIYVYLIYGMYWMFNIVAGNVNEPEAILIRGIEGCNGPGKITRKLQINGSYYGENLCISQRIWLEDHGLNPGYSCSPRIGIDYAGEPWVSKPWRYTINS